MRSQRIDLEDGSFARSWLSGPPGGGLQCRGRPKKGGGVPQAARGRLNTRDAILVAAHAILVDSGVRGLTIEGAAARSGVAKTTIYRRYRSKQDLALAVVLEMTREVVATKREGDTRIHLIGLVDTAVGLLRDTIMGRVMQGLASDIATDPQLSEAFRSRS